MLVAGDGTVLRQQADLELYFDLLAVAENPFEPRTRRLRALSFAQLWYENWLAAGRSGWRIPPGIRLRVYGNHCGPGWGRPDWPAMDAIDAGCKAHDARYRQAAALDALDFV